MHLQQMEVPRLGVKLELQLLAYTTATAMKDLSCVCDLHHSSGQCPVLNPLSHNRNSLFLLFIFYLFYLLLLFFGFLSFLEPYLWHMEVPRLGV